MYRTLYITIKTRNRLKVLEMMRQHKIRNCSDYQALLVTSFSHLPQQRLLQFHTVYILERPIFIYSCSAFPHTNLLYEEKTRYPKFGKFWPLYTSFIYAVIFYRHLGTVTYLPISAPQVWWQQIRSNKIGHLIDMFWKLRVDGHYESTDIGS